MLKHKAFTIIELLIVIVIIGVLVAITAVSYTGITKSAKDAALKSELKQISTALELNKAKTGIYPTSLATNTPPINSSNNANITYTQLNNGTSYSLTATDKSNPDISLVQTPSTSPQQASRPIQTITKANCPTTRTMVRDARDNSTYWIQRLADNQCWMLTNLAYAGGGTNTYSDVMGAGVMTRAASNSWWSYSQPAYYVEAGANPTIEPEVPSTSINGIGQFGYHYNWCAAMGGQNTAACSNVTTPSPNPAVNICPAGWRLPTGGVGGELSALNGAVNGGLTTNSRGLLETAMMQLGGDIYLVHLSSGTRGLYHSSTQASTTASSTMDVTAYTVDPTNTSNHKVNGRSVRCIAQ